MRVVWILAGVLLVPLGVYVATRSVVGAIVVLIAVRLAVFVVMEVVDRFLSGPETRQKRALWNRD